MKNRLISYAAILVSAFLVSTVPALSGQTGCVIPFRSEGHLIVVEASIGHKRGLRFMIDTAATRTVVDRKIIKALRLEHLSGNSQITALGHVSKAPRYDLHMMKIGPVYTILRLHCFEADLSGLGVDGIIGTDLLGQQTWLASCDTKEVIGSGSFTIDFKNRRLYFGIPQQLEHTARLEPSNSQFIVVAMIQGHPLRLAVDTGSHTIVLYKESRMGWLEPRILLNALRFLKLGGMGGGKEVILADIELGKSRWTNPSAILMDLPNESKDGLLSVWQLGMKIVHFDFEQNLMSWDK